MNSPFQQQYRSLFAQFGYPLKPSAGVTEKQIAAAEKRLGVRVPAALREFYLVAGKERRFNHCHNRLLGPERWAVDRGRLMFMEENQSVLWWGVPVGKRAAADPMVAQGLNDEPITWQSISMKCSAFLIANLCWHAVCGGLPHCGNASAPETSTYRFEKHGWTPRGKLGGVSTYSRQDQVVCLSPPAGFMTRWAIFAGAKTEKLLQSLCEELGVQLS
jgi:hypothetical protein